MKAPLRTVLATAAFLVALATGACGRPPERPIQELLIRMLKPGDRVLLARTLDPEGTRLAAVIDSATGKPELRLYDRKGPREYQLVHTVQQGDFFRNLGLEDVDGDGKDEIVSTWEGGHLEIVDVIARGADDTYRSIFQNAGREIEMRYDPAGRIEFWITSRTYEEGPGETPGYATTVYRFQNGRYVEAAPQ